ncbi:conserved hypothetical protein [Streptomyces sp. SPB78]|nr:conserved hypothetical protein [Streptomyces sp. SPB78]
MIPGGSGAAKAGGVRGAAPSTEVAAAATASTARTPDAPVRPRCRREPPGAAGARSAAHPGHGQAAPGWNSSKTGPAMRFTSHPLGQISRNLYRRQFPNGSADPHVDDSNAASPAVTGVRTLTPRGLGALLGIG